MKFTLRKSSIEKAINQSLKGSCGVCYEGFGRGKGSLRTYVRNGKAHFYFRYRSLDGATHDLPLGQYVSDSQRYDLERGLLGVTQARELASKASREHVRALDEGFSGVLELRAHNRKRQSLDRLTNLCPEGKTLQNLLEVYIAVKAEEGRDSKDIANLFKNYVFNSNYANKLVSEITPQDIASIIRPCAKKTIRQWQKLRSYMQAAFNQALNAEIDETIDQRFMGFELTNIPFIGLSKKGCLNTRIRDRVLTDVELKELLSILDDGYKADIVRLVILTGQRMKQLLRVPLSAFDESACELVLLDKKGSRHEEKKHTVYLEKKSIEIVKRFAEKSRSIGSDFLFASSNYSHVDQGIISKYVNSLSKSLVLSGVIHSPFKAMDIRSTVATGMSRIGVSDEVKKRLLSHGLSGVHDRHYNRYSYAKEIRAAMKQWEREVIKIGRE